MSKFVLYACSDYIAAGGSAACWLDACGVFAKHAEHGQNMFGSACALWAYRVRSTKATYGYSQAVFAQSSAICLNWICCKFSTVCGLSHVCLFNKVSFHLGYLNSCLSLVIDGYSDDDIKSVATIDDINIRHHVYDPSQWLTAGKWL